jgi:hypothetical protein
MLMVIAGVGEGGMEVSTSCRTMRTRTRFWRTTGGGTLKEEEEVLREEEEEEQQPYYPC